MYDTPSHLAHKLVRHVPKRLTRVLEPAVGKGALLRPLLRRFQNQNPRLVCIDIDADSLDEVHTVLQSRGIQAEYVNKDFLDWATLQPASSFDCILMNPPFAGSRRDCRRLQVPSLKSVNIDLPRQSRPRRPLPTSLIGCSLPMGGCWPYFLAPSSCPSRLGGCGPSCSRLAPSTTCTSFQQAPSRPLTRRSTSSCSGRAGGAALNW